MGYNTSLISTLPKAAELLQVIGLTFSEEQLKIIHDTIIEYDFGNLRNNYKINLYNLSTSRKAVIIENETCSG
jgi:hypothetical protein